MAQESSLKKNMVLNAALAVTSMVFPMITFPYITRILNPSGLGKVQFVISVVAYFSMMAGMGIQTYAVRECAKERDDKEKLSRIVHELLMVNAVTVGVVYIALLFYVIFVPRAKGDELLYFIIGLSIFFDCLGAEWLYTAKELFTYKTLRTIIFNALTLAATFLFVRGNEDYLIYGMICVLPSIGNGLTNMINMRKHIYLKSVGDYHPISHVKYIFMFFALAAATKIYTNLDTVMLGFMQGDEQVGYYSAAVKVKTIMVSVVTSLSAVLLPRMSSYVEKGDMEGLKSVIKKMMHFSVILSLAGVLFFGLYVNETIRILAGAEFMPSVTPMQIITPAVLFIAATDIMGLQLLVPLGHEKKVVISVIAGALLDLIINVLMIPRYGASGAAAGTVAAEAMVFVVQFIMVRKLGYRLFEGIQLPGIIVASLMGMLASFFVKQIIASYILSFFIGGAVFLIVVIIALLLLKDSVIWELTATFKRRLSK